MKKLSLLVSFCSAILFSCSKDNVPDTDFSNIKIASVSGIGNFTYKNDRLLSIGDETFFYNSSGRISGSRIYRKDTTQRSLQGPGLPATLAVNESIERCTYVWEGSKVKEKIVDSLYNKFFILNTQTGPVENTINVSLLTAFNADKFYFSGDRLDSLSYTAYLPGASSSRVNFLYNQNGDLIKTIEYVTQPGSFPLGGISKMKIETEITYDNHPNPFYHLFKQTGLLLNKVKEFNFSPHNPTKIAIKVTNQTDPESFIHDPINLTRDISYEYNSKGWPVKIFYQQELVGPKTYTITYK